jgi:hypothetical protein
MFCWHRFLMSSSSYVDQVFSYELVYRTNNCTNIQHEVNIKCMSIYIWGLAHSNQESQIQVPYFPHGQFDSDFHAGNIN